MRNFIYCSLNILLERSASKWMRRYSKHGEKEYLGYKLLVGKPEGTRQLGRHNRTEWVTTEQSLNIWEWTPFEWLMIELSGGILRISEFHKRRRILRLAERLRTIQEGLQSTELQLLCISRNSLHKEKSKCQVRLWQTRRSEIHRITLGGAFCAQELRKMSMYK
jgi:hypothetical protein